MYLFINTECCRLKQKTYHKITGLRCLEGQRDSFRFTFSLGQTALQQLRRFTWVRLSFFFPSFLPSFPSSLFLSCSVSLLFGVLFPLISVAQDQALATTVSAFHNAVAKDFTVLATGPMLFLPQSPSLSSPTLVRHFGICRGFSFSQRAKMSVSHTAVFKLGNQQGPPAQHRELCSLFSGSLGGRGFGGEWVLIRVYVWVPLLFTWNYHNIFN